MLDSFHQQKTQPILIRSISIEATLLSLWQNLLGKYTQSAWRYFYFILSERKEQTKQQEAAKHYHHQRHKPRWPVYIIYAKHNKNQQVVYDVQ